MKAFAYEAADRTGRMARGRVIAESEPAALDQLARDGMFPLRVRAAPTSTPWWGRPSRRDLAAAFRSLASLVEVGVPVEQALATTAALFPDPLTSRLNEARRLLQVGLTLSAALEQVGGVLPPVVQGILRAGEEGSQMGHGLEQAARVLEREADLAGRLQQALAYPVLLGLTGLCSIGFIVGVVVPRFATLLADLAQEPPMATRILLGLSSLVRGQGVLWLLLVAVLSTLALSWLRTQKGRSVGDRLLLEAPLLGPLVHQLATSRVAGAIGGMLSAGVPILAAVRAAAHAAGNGELRTRLEQSRERTSLGERFSAALEGEAALWPPAVRLIAIGEANGRLAEMALAAGDLAATEAERRLKMLTSLLEPALILGFAMAVGFVAAALLQAVYSLRPGVGT